MPATNATNSSGDNDDPLAVSTDSISYAQTADTNQDQTAGTVVAIVLPIVIVIVLIAFGVVAYKNKAAGSTTVAAKAAGADTVAKAADTTPSDASGPPGALRRQATGPVDHL